MLIGALLGLGSVVAAVVWAVGQSAGAVSFASPGETVFDAPNGESGTIWNEIQGATRGPRGAMMARPPAGLSVQVTDAETGRDVPVRASAMMMWERVGSTGRLAIYQFTPRKPGKYIVRGSGPACTLTVSKGAPGGMVGGVLGGMCGGLIGGLVFVAGMMMVIITVVRHSRTGGGRRTDVPPDQMP